MPEETRPQFAVTLGGEEIPLRYEVRDWIAAERNLGVAFYPWGRSAWWRQLDGALGLSSLVDLLLVGVGHCKPDLTREQVVEALADPELIDKVNEQVGAAASDFFVKVGLLPAPESQMPPTAETGSRSGPTAGTISDCPSPSS